jgi:hypothetical protein
VNAGNPEEVEHNVALPPCSAEGFHASMRHTLGVLKAV